MMIMARYDRFTFLYFINMFPVFHYRPAFLISSTQLDKKNILLCVTSIQDVGTVSLLSTVLTVHVLSRKQSHSTNS